MTTYKTLNERAGLQALAWINFGVGGVTWRAGSIKEAVEECVLCAAQDFGGLRGEQVSVAVYKVPISSSVLFAGHMGSVYLGESVDKDVLDETQMYKEAEIPLLHLVKVAVPRVRKNGSAYSASYTAKVKRAVDAALEPFRYENI